jgi:hypothetical protein
VSTGALICLGQPRTLCIVPSFGEWRADASHERLGVRKISCRQRPSRSAYRHLDATKMLERLRALCVYLGRACSLAGDIGRQPWLVLSGIAKGQVAGGIGGMPPLSLLTLCDEAIG